MNVLTHVCLNWLVLSAKPVGGYCPTTSLYSLAVKRAAHAESEDVFFLPACQTTAARKVHSVNAWPITQKRKSHFAVWYAPSYSFVTAIQAKPLWVTCFKAMSPQQAIVRHSTHQLLQRPTRHALRRHTARWPVTCWTCKKPLTCWFGRRKFKLSVMLAHAPAIKHQAQIDNAYLQDCPLTQGIGSSTNWNTANCSQNGAPKFAQAMFLRYVLNF